MKIHYITSFYSSDDPKRQLELEHCIQHNLKALYFDFITILDETDTLKIDNDSCCIVHTNGRPTFSSIFQFAKDDCINVVSNLDIIFDKTIRRVCHIRDHDFWCLGRYESSQKTNLFRAGMADTQDVWIFKGKPKISLSCDFFMGVKACDNRLARVAFDHGYKIKNPSLSIYTMHVHRSCHRTYDKKSGVEGSYAFIKPSHLKFWYWSNNDVLFHFKWIMIQLLRRARNRKDYILK